MRHGPDIAALASLIGDPARANILTALMAGKALTASELAAEAGVTAQTASAHLRKLENGGLLARRAQGRHAYFTLAGAEVARALEALMGLAAGKGHLRTRPGPKDAELRHARVCYNHLAGETGVRMFRALQARGAFAAAPEGLALTAKGETILAALGVDLTPARGPQARECLDWSMRQSHLGGRLGRAMLAAMEGKGWLTRVPDTRILRFSRAGQAAFDETFGAANA
ncbi:MAG: winged helix-turn-helix transcriptional regulator [Pseudooceanicola sp.]|nr:winged helix-turn-helix transcriptional regulator [Pseudooceanicola sp.]